MHFVTTYHAPYAEDFPGKHAYNAVMARGERVIAISRFVADEVARRHGVEAARIRVIPRGVDPAVFDPARVSFHRVGGLAEEWRVPLEHEVIMLPGRLTRWKGQAVLIEALARMQRRNTTVVLAGGDRRRRGYAPELVALAERLGVAERVRIVGDCDDMPTALALASVVVNASTEPEGFGRVIVEAQAMARPVIASGHGGAAETIEHGADRLACAAGRCRGAGRGARCGAGHGAAGACRVRRPGARGGRAAFYGAGDAGGDARGLCRVAGRWFRNGVELAPEWRPRCP